MRKKFIGYYKLSEKDFQELWSKGLFVFDTNVLLDLYRYSDETVKSLINTMESIKDRIWIPYQVAKEYHNNLNGIISEQVKKYNSSIDTLLKFKKQIEEKRSHPFLNDDLQNEIQKFCDKFDGILKERKSDVKNLILSNPIKEKIADILEGKLGDSLSEEELSKLYTEGEKRYKNSIPPGFLDRKKPMPKRYGDLIVWKEILNKNKDIDQPIIFITRDTKDDWFMNEMGLTISPRPELIEEFTRVKPNLFYSYTTSSFLTYAKQYLKVEINDNSIGEIEEILKKLQNSGYSNETVFEDLFDDDFILPDENESVENNEDVDSSKTATEEGNIEE